MTNSESPGETIGSSGISPGEVSVTALREAMAAGGLTSADLVRFYLERIERHNPASGAVISVADDAVEQASAVDRGAGGRCRTRPAGRHPRADQGQHLRGWLARDRWLSRAARRGGGGRLPHRQAARGERRHPGQGQPVRVGELPLHAVLERLVDAGRAGGEPARHRPEPVRVRAQARRSRWPLGSRRWPSEARPTARS